MSTIIPPQPANPFDNLKSRSAGTKFFVLFALAIVMSIPCLFVNGCG